MIYKPVHEPMFVLGNSSGGGNSTIVTARCELISGFFAFFVQGSLAVAGAATLLFKRWRENPRRPWLIWLFDVSKQCISGFLQHGVNILFGVWFAHHSLASQCAWYLVNFTISVVSGVFILWLFILAYRHVVEKYSLTMLRSGEYGDPPKWQYWLAQVTVWSIFSCVEKGITASAVILPLRSSLDHFAVWLESPMIAHPNEELVLVMVIAPCILNMIFFYIIDNLIMRRGHGMRFHNHDDSDTWAIPTNQTSSSISRSINSGGRLTRWQSESELSSSFLGLGIHEESRGFPPSKCVVS